MIQIFYLLGLCLWSTPIYALGEAGLGASVGEEIQKERQKSERNIEPLHEYINYPQPSTCAIKLPRFDVAFDNDEQQKIMPHGLSKQNLLFFQKINSRPFKTEDFINPIDQKNKRYQSRVKLLRLMPSIYTFQISLFEGKYPFVNFKNFRCKDGQSFFLFAGNYTSENKEIVQKVHIMDSLTLKILWEGPVEEENLSYTVDLNSFNK
ncbi:MAG: hypothetical protein QNL04_09065 [SAR324 cluster bacterium]|nr:hypothetical protein [SAR324 cluster bacterium]